MTIEHGPFPVTTETGRCSSLGFCLEETKVILSLHVVGTSLPVLHKAIVERLILGEVRGGIREIILGEVVLPRILERLMVRILKR